MLKNSTSKTESSQELLNIKKLIIFKDLFIEYYEDKYRENGNSFNPFQEDKNPSFKLYDDHGCDFGSDDKTYDIFDLHKLKFDCSKAEAIRALKTRAAGGIVTDPPKKSTTSTDKDKPKEGFNPWKDGKISLTYAYTDEKGELLYENVRFVPQDPSKWPDISKTFIQRKPDPNMKSGWSYKLADTKRVPFGLPELIAASKDQPVYVCEGEKDTIAMRKLGFVATSVGSAKTGPTNLKKHKVVDYFVDRHVILVADKDEDGRKYCAKVAPVYAEVAASVKIIEMPGDGIKDPADLVESQGKKSREIIEGVVNSTKEYAPGIATANKVTELKND
ncbi:MAG: toprim domain-containing protein, partial [Pseudomonadota bacterium]